MEAFSTDMAVMADGIRSSSAHRRAMVNGMRSEVAGLLAWARRARNDIGRAGAHARKRTLAAIGHRVEEIEAQTRTMITAFGRTRHRMADRLGKALAAGQRDRLHDVHALLEQCRTMREAMRKDFQAGRRAWMGMAGESAEPSGHGHGAKTSEPSVRAKQKARERGLR